MKILKLVLGSKLWELSRGSVVAPYAGHHIGIGKPPKRVAVEIKCVGLFKVLRDGVLLLVLLTKWH